MSDLIAHATCVFLLVLTKDCHGCSWDDNSFLPSCSSSPSCNDLENEVHSAPLSQSTRVLSTSAPASTSCLLGNFEVISPMHCHMARFYHLIKGTVLSQGTYVSHFRWALIEIEKQRKRSLLTVKSCD